MYRDDSYKNLNYVMQPRMYSSLHPQICTHKNRSVCCLMHHQAHHALESEKWSSYGPWFSITDVALGGRSSEDAQAGWVFVPTVSCKHKDSVTAPLDRWTLSGCIQRRRSTPPSPGKSKEILCAFVSQRLALFCHHISDWLNSRTKVKMVAIPTVGCTPRYGLIL